MQAISVIRLIEKARKSQYDKLDLSRRKLTWLPQQVGQLIQLRELYLSRNRLASLPLELGWLTQLTRSVLSRNRREAEADGLFSEVAMERGDGEAWRHLDQSRLPSTRLAFAHRIMLATLVVVLAAIAARCQERMALS